MRALFQNHYFKITLRALTKTTLVKVIENVDGNHKKSHLDDSDSSKIKTQKQYKRWQSGSRLSVFLDKKAFRKRNQNSA